MLTTNININQAIACCCSFEGLFLVLNQKRHLRPETSFSVRGSLEALSSYSQASEESVRKCTESSIDIPCSIDRFGLELDHYKGITCNAHALY